MRVSCDLVNGLRVVTYEMKNIETFACGMWIKTGSRDEKGYPAGISHVVEHMLFKGTKNRTAAQISADIENAGGSMNAYTSREVTAYHARGLKSYINTAINVLFDMILCPTFDEKELELEKHVIVQEIKQYNDMPDEIASDLFYETAFSGHDMGNPIAGTEESVMSITREHIVNYYNDKYSLNDMVFCAVGNIKHGDIIKQIEQLHNTLPNNIKHNKTQTLYSGGITKKHKSVEQSHVLIGYNGPSIYQQDRFAVCLFSTIIGGNSSSRLFQEVREKRGLVYTISSGLSCYTDIGLFSIYFCASPSDVDKAMSIVEDVLSGVVEISDEEYHRAQNQLQFAIASEYENVNAICHSIACDMLFHNKSTSLEEKLNEIMSISKAHILQKSIQILSTQSTIVYVGPNN